MENDFEFEKAFWGDCCNTLDEEAKHYVYARLMGIPLYCPGGSISCGFSVGKKSILDLGGGPVSMLLKTKQFTKAKVVDPITYPKWTAERYAAHGIELQVAKAEQICESGWDEVWIYNCLQHVDDPELILHNALQAGKIVRIFEWIDIPAHDGHPHELTRKNLYLWLGTKGNTVNLSESGCYGHAYFAVRTSHCGRGR